MSSSLKFPIPDWGEDVFKYPGTNISGDTIIKKKKRKRDGENVLKKCQADVDKESPQRNSKKKKSDQTVLIPDKKILNGTKEQKDTKTTKILPHQENNLDVSTTKKKRKRNRKNNKYKELNERQKGERMAKAGAAVDKSELHQQGTIMKMKENQDTAQLITKKEETQHHSEHEDTKRKKKKSKLFHKDGNIQITNASHEKLITKDEKNHHDKSELIKKKKKKKEKLLNHSHDNIVEDNNDNQEKATDTSHYNSSQDITKVETPSQTKKKKKSANKLIDTILFNGKETETSLGNENHLNAVFKEVKKKKKTKGIKKGGEESTKRMNNLGTSPLAHESETGGTENKVKRKMKIQEKVKESGEFSNGKDSVSNTKTTKLGKQKNRGKSSKTVKEVVEDEQDEKEELLFDGDEECNESFKEDLGALISSLNFGNFKTKGSKKRKSNTEDSSDVEMNDGGEILETECGNKAKGKEEGLKKRKKKKKKVEEEEKNVKSSPKKINVEKSDAIRNEHATPLMKKVPKFDREKVAKLLEEAARMEKEKPSPPAGNSLKERMEGRLMAARFRMVNQELYTKSSNEAKELFKKDPAAFDIYHQGYQAQVKQWPVNPLDVVIKWLTNRATELVVADMGCGEGMLSQRVPQKCVHSLDLVASNPWVTPCDMAHTPLAAASVDVVVFCLSLMGTNIKDFMKEANRILKPGGILKIAEVESRFNDVKEFEKHLVKYGFHCTARDTSHKYFFILDFKKNHKLKKTVLLPDIILKPCLYKKR